MMNPTYYDKKNKSKHIWIPNHIHIQLKTPYKKHKLNIRIPNTI